MKIETTQAAVDIFGLLCGAGGFGIGWVLCWRRQVARLQESQRRADEAYRRYWNGYTYDEPREF